MMRLFHLISTFPIWVISTGTATAEPVYCFKEEFAIGQIERHEANGITIRSRIVSIQRQGEVEQISYEMRYGDDPSGYIQTVTVDHEAKTAHIETTDPHLNIKMFTPQPYWAFGTTCTKLGGSITLTTQVALPVVDAFKTDMFFSRTLKSVASARDGSGSITLTYEDIVHVSVAGLPRFDPRIAKIIVDQTDGLESLAQAFEDLPPDAFVAFPQADPIVTEVTVDQADGANIWIE